MWNSSQLSKALGVLAPEVDAKRIVIDSRVVQPGDIYVALKGERLDGHEFIDAAFSKGAVAAIAERGDDARIIKVENSYRALEALGAYKRAQFKGRVVGLTGSVGKTTTKEMVKLALSAYGEAYATPGNFNNHIGVPLTLANMPEDAAFAVIEMGMNHAGEISQLTKQARPDVALITTVDAVHLEFFASIEAIADAKCEIFEGLAPGGTAIVNVDNAYGEYCAKHAKGPVLRVGAKGDLSLLSATPNANGTALSLAYQGKTFTMHIGAIGEPVVRAAMMAVAVVLALGLDPTPAFISLSGFKEVGGRGALQKVRDFYVLDDAYNASPASMKAAFEKTKLLRTMHKDITRVVAVLGDMLELGASEVELHLSLVPALNDSGIDVVHTAGARMEHVHKALKPAMQGIHTATAAELGVQLKPQAGDLVLLKGSHGSKIYELAEKLSA